MAKIVYIAPVCYFGHSSRSFSFPRGGLIALDDDDSPFHVDVTYKTYDKNFGTQSSHQRTSYAPPPPTTTTRRSSNSSTTSSLLQVHTRRRVASCSLQELQAQATHPYHPPAQTITTSPHNTPHRNTSHYNIAAEEE